MRCARLIALMTALLLTAALQAQNTRSQEERKARLEKEIALLDRQLGDNESRSRSALGNLALVQKKVSMRRELLQQSEEQVRSYDRAIRARDREIRSLEARLDTLETYYSRLVYAVYKNRDAREWYMYILASDNIGQAWRRYSYFRDMSASLNAQAVRIRKERETLEEEKQAVRRLRNEAEIVRSQHALAVKALSQEEEQSRQLVETLKRDRRRYESELASKRKEVEALNREIERLIRESSSGGKGSAKKPKPVDYTLAAEFSKNKGKLPWPADGSVTDRFGQRFHPVFTTVKLPFNNGIDIATAKGAEVKAVFDGEVRQIVVMPGYNKCVLVQHGNYFTFYCKLKSCSVKAGDKVKTGQTLGTVDTIYGETELHFQVWKDQTPQNPETWLRPR